MKKISSLADHVQVLFLKRISVLWVIYLAKLV